MYKDTADTVQVQFLQYFDRPLPRKPQMHDQYSMMCVLTRGLLFCFDPERFWFNTHFIKCYWQNDHMRGKQQLSPKLVQNMQIKPTVICYVWSG